MIYLFVVHERGNEARLVAVHADSRSDAVASHPELMLSTYAGEASALPIQLLGGCDPMLLVPVNLCPALERAAMDELREMRELADEYPESTTIASRYQRYAASLGRIFGELDDDCDDGDDRVYPVIP
jgi:hypothetical protein